MPRRFSQAIGLDGFHFRWLKMKYHQDRDESFKFYLDRVLNGEIEDFDAKKDGTTVKDLKILRTFKTF